MNDTYQVTENYTVTKDHYKSWLNTLSKSPDLAFKLDPVLFVTFFSQLANKPELIVSDIINLPKTLAEQLIVIEKEHKIIQIERLKFHINLIREYISLKNLQISVLYNEALDLVLPQLNSFLLEFEERLSQLESTSNNVLAKVDQNSNIPKSDSMQTDRQFTPELRNSITPITELKPVKFWSATDKGRYLSIIFPNLDAPTLARKYCKVLSVEFSTLNRTIHKHRNNELVNSKIDKDLGENALRLFLESENM